MRTAGARPVWAELRQEIREERAGVIAWLRAHDAWRRGRAEHILGIPAERILAETARTREIDRRVRLEVARRVDELNALVRRHNLLVTVTPLHVSTVTVDEIVSEAREAP